MKKVDILQNESNRAHFGTAYQSGYSFVRLTPIIERESKGCVSLSYWNQGHIYSYIEGES